ncbi:MAG TPA: hypothetical protein VL346_08765 [Acidobacteriaceae bacterium]|nr:hypothetical protein [Acidobacteriaceae bacterium]
MHLLAAIWLYQSGASNDTVKKLDHLVTVVVPLAGALIPTAAAAMIKWLQDHDLRRRRASLTEDLTKLAKNLADLPPMPESPAVQQMRAALNTEMEAGVRELLLLQAHAPRRSMGISSVAWGLKSMFLWWQPRGFKAWMLHLGFWASLLVIGFLTIGMSEDSAKKKAAISQHASSTQSLPDTSSSAATTQGNDADVPTTPLTVVMIYVLFGIPPLIFRHFAAGIHRKQCMEDAARAAAVQAARANGAAGGLPAGA